MATQMTCEISQLLYAKPKSCNRSRQRGEGMKFWRHTVVYFIFFCLCIDVCAGKTYWVTTGSHSRQRGLAWWGGDVQARGNEFDARIASVSCSLEVICSNFLLLATKMRYAIKILGYEKCNKNLFIRQLIFSNYSIPFWHLKLHILSLYCGCILLKVTVRRKDLHWSLHSLFLDNTFYILCSPIFIWICLFFQENKFWLTVQASRGNSETVLKTICSNLMKSFQSAVEWRSV